MPVVVLPLVAPGYYYGTQAETGTLSRLWLRREDTGSLAGDLHGTVWRNGEDQGITVTIPSGETEAEQAIDVDTASGDDIRVYISGGLSISRVSGVLKSETVLYRLTPSSLGTDTPGAVTALFPYVSTDGRPGFTLDPTQSVGGWTWDEVEGRHHYDSADTTGGEMLTLVDDTPWSQHAD